MTSIALHPAAPAARGTDTPAVVPAELSAEHPAPPPAARNSELTPWDFFPAVARRPVAAGDLDERAAAWLARRRADVEALTALDEFDELPVYDPTGPDHPKDETDSAVAAAAVTLAVARHLRGALDVASTAEPGDAARHLRRVLGGYEHHLEHHRFLGEQGAGMADFLLWEVVIVVPVLLGDEGAAEVLRGRVALERWAKRLAARHRPAVVAIGYDAVDRVVRPLRETAPSAVGVGVAADRH